MRNLFTKIKSMLNLMDEPEADASDTPLLVSPESSTLSDYLSYYSKLDAPGYAVLVTGPWGVGKTHQVKEIIPENERYYVSLYGLDSVAAINDAVLAASLPGSETGGQLATTLGDVGKAMGDKFALAGFASTIWTAFLRTNLSPDRTLIFDDLERSTLWSAGEKSALLGAINQYVEHGNFRVVVICHDEVVADEIALLKEKTFGHTVEAEPQTERALSQFIDEPSIVEAKSFLEARRALIREVWDQSGQCSLRILRHVVTDIRRLHDLLEQRHKEHAEAIDHLLRLFIALDIEVRAGEVDEPSLGDRYRKYIGEIANRKEDIPRPISKLADRYPGSDITGSMLSDELLIEMLIKGRYDRQKVAEWLDQTSYFAAGEETAPWQIVIGFDNVDDAVLSEGINRMNAQFEDRKTTEMGEFFHVAALRLMMAENGALPHDVATEEGLCHQYIDDLVKEGRLPPKPLEYDPSDRIVQAYAGHVYWGVDRSLELQRVIKHWQCAASDSLDQKLPEYGSEILEMLRTNPKEIFKTISTTNYNYCPLSHTPFMQHIEPSAFVDAWLNGPRSSWRDTSLALDNRYAHGALGDGLAPEKAWLLQVANALDEHIGATHGLARFRLERLKPKIFHEVQQEATG